MDKKIKKVFLTYDKDGNNNLIGDKFFRMYDDGSFDQEPYDPSKHGQEIQNVINEYGIEGNDLVESAINAGVFARFDKNELSPEKLQEFWEKETPEIHVAENDEGTPKKDHKIAKRVAAGVLAAGAIAGGLALFHGCSKEQVVEEEEEIKNSDDLYANMSEEQKAFFSSSFSAVEFFNTRTTEDGNFKLDEDKSTLHITVDEAIALNIVLNNYSADELYEIFGTLEFDTTNLMNLARSSYSKLSTYYMNATKPSGLSALINNESARAFFEKHENAVIAFNNNPTTELSDQVIKGLYYDYVYGGSTGEYSKINNDGVAWFATSAGFGFELANRNVEEFLRINNVSEEENDKYQEAAAEVGMSLNQITTSELLNGINEEIDIDVIDEINNKSLCAAVTTQTRDKVNALQMKQQIATTIVATNAKTDLVDGLKEIGAHSLANKVMASDGNLSAELLEEISSYSKDGNQLIEDYHGTMNAATDKEARILAVLEIARETYDVKSEIDLPDLRNNRFRTIEKEKEDGIRQEIGSDGIPVVDGDDFNKLTDGEKEDYIKDNGKEISSSTTTTNTPVDKNDLTSGEKQQVESQEAILKEVETMENNLRTSGVEDALARTEQTGAYPTKSVVNPYNNETVDLSKMSVFNAVAHDFAFGDGVNDLDKNNPLHMNEDSKDEYAELGSLSSGSQNHLKNKYGSDWKEDVIDEFYETSYKTQYKTSLNAAEKQGGVLKASAEKAYNDMQKEVEETNRQEGVQTPQPVVPEDNTNQNTPDTSDPNLNPDYGQEDEMPYVPSVDLKEPLQYVSDEEWEATYGNAADTSESKEARSSQPVVPEDTTVQITSDTSDTNLNTNYSQEDELPYVPSVELKEPFYVVSDEEWEAAYGSAVGEEAPTKVK